MKRIAVSARLGLAVAIVLAIQAPVQAQAGHLHAVRTADSPSSGQPIAGGGTWIVNRADAYYIGRLRPGSSFENQTTDRRGWHYGRAFGSVDMCGWAMPGSLGAQRGDVANSCSATTMRRMSHRRYIGRDFNASAHVATDGSPAPAVAGCGMAYNYFHGSDFTRNSGHPADYAGPISPTVKYRFTTNDGLAAVVRDPVLGWGFVAVGCVQRPAELFNDDD